MVVVAQRVTSAKVQVNGENVAEIADGLLLLVGVSLEDDYIDAAKLAKKLVNMRIFADEGGKMNLSVKDTGGSFLCVSQFTLLAHCRKGNRPSFTTAAPPAIAVPMFEYFKKQLADEGIPVKSGIFGADMQVSLLNDGPVTIVLDSTNL